MPQSQKGSPRFAGEAGFSHILIVVFLVVLFLGALVYFKNNFTSSSVTIFDTNFRIYRDPSSSFSLQYPASWQVVESEPETFQKDENGKYIVDPGSKKDVVFSGKEGKLEIYWGDSFGGGCGIGYEKLNFKNVETETCHLVNDSNYPDQEVWVGMQEILNISDHTGVYVNAYANKPVDKNREILLKMMASLELKQDEEVRVEEAVSLYYSYYIVCLQDYENDNQGKSIQEVCPQDQSRFVSSEVIDKIEKKAKGFDPFICAQNVPIGTTAIPKEVKINGDKATTNAYLGFAEEQIPIKVDLQKANNEWKIADISCN